MVKVVKAKITINDSQAAVLGRLASHTSCNPVLYDPRTGVNLQKTKVGKYITVYEGKNLDTLKKYQKLGCFSVVSGSVLPAPTLNSIAISGTGNTMITLTFSEGVNFASLLATDIELKIDDAVVADLVIPARKASSNTLSVDLGEADLTGKEISFQVKESGASKIFNKYNACLTPTIAEVI